MEEGVRWLLLGGVLLVCCILQVIVTSFKIAIDHINDSDLEELRKKDEVRAKRLEQYHSDDHLLVITSSFLQIFASTGIMITMFLLLWQRIFLPMDMAVKKILFGILAACIYSVLYAVFFYGVPYRISSKKHGRTALRYVNSYGMLCNIFRPLIWLYDLLTRKCSGFFGVDPKEEVDDVTEEEIISIVNEGHEHGVLLASEAAMIHNIFEFGDKDAKDVMIHRRQIVALDGNMTFREVMDLVEKEAFSRYPVYLGDLDNIIGVLHIKDALGYAKDPGVYDKKIRDFGDILHSAEFVPETHSLNSLFAKMQSKKKHMMLVVDEYGQTSGLISLEDILEEIVGNIQDEHDEEEASIEQLAPDYYRMDGSTTLEEVSQVLGISFPDEYETLNGFLIAHIDKIPEEHEQFEVFYEGYHFVVQDVEGKMIQQVQVSVQKE